MTPTVGRMVYYRAYGTPNGEYKSVDRSATITEVISDTVVSLCVFNPTGLFFNQNVTQGSNGGQWDWMPFQKEQQSRLESQIVVPELQKDTSPTAKTPETPKFDFGDAIRHANAGHKVARSGWNGKGMWIAKSGVGTAEGGGRITSARDFWNPHSKAFAEENGGSAEVLPTFIMKTADGKILMGWLASQSDMFAQDWVIVE